MYMWMKLGAAITWRIMANEVQTTNNMHDMKSPPERHDHFLGPPGNAVVKDDNSNIKKSKTPYILFVSLVLDLLAFTVILPLLPGILDYYAKHDAKDGLFHWLYHQVTAFRDFIGAPGTDKLNSVLFGGLIGSLFSFLQFVSSPLIGALSDVYGRTPLLMLSSIGIAVSYMVWIWSSNFSIFVLSRIIGGISKGNISLGTAIVADETGQKERAKGMAMIGIAFSVGFVVGPIIGAAFSVMSRAAPGSDAAGSLHVAPAYFALTLALLNCLYVAVVFKETLPKSQRASSVFVGLRGATNFINPVSLFKFNAVQKMTTKDISAIRQLGMAYFLYLFFFSGLEFTLTFLTHLRFNYTSMEQGKMFFFIGLVMALVQGGYVRRISPETTHNVALRGLGIIIPSFFIIGFAESKWSLYLGLFLYSYASATVVPCLTAMMSSYGKVTQKGTVLGIGRSLGALARALGPLFASCVYWSFGPEGCYAMGAAGLVAPLFLLRKYIKLHIKQSTN